MAPGFRTRRSFLGVSAAASGVLLAGRALGEDVDPRVAKVMAATVAVDMHNHVYPAGTEPHPGLRSLRADQVPKERPLLVRLSPRRRRGRNFSSRTS
jgi:hypothetical protein